MKAVTALMGRLPSNPGTLAIKLHNKLITTPIIMTDGTRILWSLVLKMNLVRCGMASPKNDIGPQYAVTMAVKYPDINIIIRLLFLTFRPRFSAYKSPNNKMFRLLDKNKLADNPNIIAMMKNVSLLDPTAENDPIPQMTYAWISSFILKNFRMSVNEPARYEIINPMIISVVMFLILLLNPNISIKTKVAPTKAEILTPMFAHNPNDDKADPPKMPVNKIVIATPRPAPLLMPSMDGSASGFLNKVCIKSPDTDKAAPAKSAVMACGSL